MGLVTFPWVRSSSVTLLQCLAGHCWVTHPMMFALCSGPAMYMPDSSGSPRCFALEQQQCAQMLSRSFADSKLEQPKNVTSYSWKNLSVSQTYMHIYCIISHDAALAPSVCCHQKPLLEILFSPGHHWLLSQGDSLSAYIGYQRAFFSVKSFYSGVLDNKARKDHFV